MNRSTFVSIILVLASSVLVSCYAPHPDPYVRQGRRGGAALGAATGAIIGNNVKGGNAWGGAAIGAALGGMAGDHRGKMNSMYYRHPGPRHYPYRGYRYRYY